MFDSVDWGSLKVFHHREKFSYHLFNHERLELSFISYNDLNGKIIYIMILKIIYFVI